MVLTNYLFISALVFFLSVAKLLKRAENRQKVVSMRIRSLGNLTYILSVSEYVRGSFKISNANKKFITGTMIHENCGRIPFKIYLESTLTINEYGIGYNWPLTEIK